MHSQVTGIAGTSSLKGHSQKRVIAIRRRQLSWNQPLERAQGALLLSYQASPDDPQLGSLLLANAIQNTTIVGKPPTPLVPVRNSTLKRLWWSIILRDRCICFALRRRTQVTPAHFDAEDNYFDQTDFENEVTQSKVYDTQSKQFLFRVLQQQCRLAVMVTDMLSVFWFPEGLTTVRLSKEFNDCMDLVLKTKDSLCQRETDTRSLMASRCYALPRSVETFIQITYMFY